MKNMKLTFVNVGYGEAILLECPDERQTDGRFIALIDGGSADASEFADRTSGRIPVWEYLAAQGIERIDLMVCTHIHEDHISGMAEAARRLPPAVLWQSLPPTFYQCLRPLDETVAEDMSQAKFLRALNDYTALCADIVRNGGAIRCVQAGETFSLCEGLSVQVLAPAADRCAALERQLVEVYAQAAPAPFLQKLSLLDAAMNNYSLILRLNYCGTHVLLPGDTNLAGYDGIAEGVLRAQLFKVGHHGQRDGADQKLVRKIRPEAVVCCASSDRRYNSAHPDTLQLLRDAGAKLYFSDCPCLPELDTPAHAALVFTIGAAGAWDAQYLPNAGTMTGGTPSWQK